MRNYINLIEAVQKGCPVATHDIDKNLKNRQAAIDNYHYGPANPDRAEGYWKDSARIFDVSEATAKTMLCGNCAAFDVSDSMRKCMADGIQGDETGVDANASINLAALLGVSSPIVLSSVALNCTLVLPTVRAWLTLLRLCSEPQW